MNYLKSRGASDSEINGLLTEDAWKKKRSTYTLTGYGDEAVKAYSSYREYLNAFTQYAMERYGK